ncbi:Nucleotidyl transferase AbiEii toxin, Type IV TA system [Pseudomonas sp. NFACC23-1]|uniref:nucleotidyl transferase AbiEii/AbiGii toxin family protein n=1 Tax=unclassified Pseudomonas TaxID=196821 RepID=UPI000891E419|nr:MULTISPECIES: nucleotidyl transferase AbiEii/AbiGii toxin family protein [unclassified Pseudomonas]SDB45907.1 Nucleotidyl transferase AbiEii toxin, Type IV TA system [Pseudomonas sp. NFACC17-2]SEJ64114.1 Nucleotidyl transferase AbiEii toxin, Type IV TA system [Pseudomonas sp. NFACC23-1]SFW80683.1 Nucleotidyl transferase AbiEii toxin, Type IV TA system [Pseudomonas sp. NFACC16-2]
MKIITPEQVDLIDAVLAEVDVGLLTASILEKDVHVTDALQALMGMRFSGVRLVFCGGTSLSKAYQLIERMSEDVDLKVVLVDPDALSVSARKRYFSNLKTQVCHVLAELGFEEIVEARVARNGNRYFASRWQYAPQYPHDTSLRPYLSLELTARTPQFEVTRQPLEYLVNRLAARSGRLGDIACVAVEETLAEKVISFLRRYAQHQAGAMLQPWDDTLVRHIYDVYCISRGDPAVGERATIGFKRLVEFDVLEFGRQFPPFAGDPGNVMRSALHQASSDAQIRSQYDARLMPLIFGDVRPSFDEAYVVFRQHAEALIRAL